MIRELWLQDDKGTKYSLNDNLRCIATRLQNLGIETLNNYYEYKNSYITATSKMPMMKPSMDLVFLEGYKGYSEFVDFFTRAKELKLYYKNIDIKYCTVDIERIDKQELSANNTLISEIIFNKKTMWMKEYAVTITTEQSGDYKQYNYEYDYKYMDVVEGQIQIENRGAVPAPINIEIDGNLLNPIIQILDDNDGVLAECKININYENSKLIIISEEGKETMKIITASGEEVNVYQNQDFTKDGFLFAPIGRSKIKIEPGMVGTYLYKVIFHELYRGN